MTLNQLRVFYTVASCGGIGAAARSLFLSQPSVTAQLRSLEKNLRVKLYDRSSGGLTLTDAGQALMRYAETIVKAEDEAIKTIGSIRGSLEGRLRVGTNTTGGMYVLPPILRRFQEEYEDVQVALSIDTSSKIIDAVMEGALDIGLAGGPIDSRRLSVRRVGREELVLIASPYRSLGRETGTITLGDLREQSLIVPEMGSRSRWLIETRLRELGLPFRISLSLPGTEAVKKAVEANLGVAFVSEYSVERELAIGAIRQLTVEGFHLVRALEMFWRRGMKLSPTAAPLLDLALAHINGASPPGSLEVADMIEAPPEDEIISPI